ncbi:MAG: YitT family protein [Clostridia bacterium]|nr:YitT family protein [Clostridia bacterium]
MSIFFEGDLMNKCKFTVEIFCIVILAALSALNYAIFIFPNQFAPAGLDGLCTMFQDVTGINIGYTSLIINIPLLVIASIKLHSNFAVKNIAFIISFSITSAVIDNFDLSSFHFYTETSTSVVLAPVAAGVIRGIIYAGTLALGGASGGIDIIAVLIRKKYPHFNLMNIIFGINMFVALCSYFVYGNELVPVVCGIIYFYITSQTSTHIQVSKKENAKIEIITQHYENLCQEITKKLRLSATVIHSHGAYSKNNNKMVVCITQKNQLPLVKELLNQFPDAVYFVSTVNESNAHSY